MPSAAGPVVIISEIGCLRGFDPSSACLRISKAADFALCAASRRRGPGKAVRVNCVRRAWSRPISPARGGRPGGLKRHCATTPLRRIGALTRDRGRVANLASDASRLRPARTHLVDGGRGDGFRRDCPYPAFLRGRVPSKSEAGGGCLANYHCRETPPRPSPASGRGRRTIARRSQSVHIDLRAQYAASPTKTTQRKQRQRISGNRHISACGHRSGHHVLGARWVSRRHLDSRPSRGGIPPAFRASGWVEHEPEERHLALDIVTCRAGHRESRHNAKDIADIGYPQTSAKPHWCGTRQGQAIHPAA